VIALLDHSPRLLLLPPVTEYLLVYLDGSKASDKPTVCGSQGLIVPATTEISFDSDPSVDSAWIGLIFLEMDAETYQYRCWRVRIVLLTTNGCPWFV
jgi:hypothetical protein